MPLWRLLMLLAELNCRDAVEESKK